MGKKIKDPGIGNTSAQYVGRLIDDNGFFNVVHLNKSKRFSEAYNYLINISWGAFFCLSFVSYIFANTCFAFLYLLIGIEEITVASGSVLQDFFNAFFFSSQTFTTLGYGAMSPTGMASGIVSSIEAFIGLMFFAFATGLLYGRFSKPKAAIRFTKHLVLNDFKEHKALMFRIENDRKSTMIHPKVAVTLTLSKKNKKGEYVNDFYNLELKRDTINYLPTTWTIVHEIDKQSPLYGFLENDITKQQGELIVMVSYYDESFNQEVHQMYSYLLKDIKLNYRFIKTYHYNENGKMVLDHKLFDVIESTKS
ncbi:ion channel [Hyunsoonleella pacifica]|uniref:Ion transporter n=1 Tax=Hyunsoonleella pacifica TaxID=1080224 RepID=A0A4Q9FWG9_9FLAO|nr:ion channel [Hyunsoonleella pacifica]TBN18895.1 ion transporter [Hyunsoonleella pacifica]GGD05672.1 inward rectifier potassium channel Irk [Hyunsoonleella pacifica]